MCGIAGIVSDRLLTYRSRLNQMSNAIAHRGPDDSGIWEDSHVLLMHRRLSIIDTSLAGHQPMHSHCGRYVMVYNGEIYNYLELRHELEGAGVVFRSQSDSEVLLAAFLAWGPECLARFNGMWAIAIWDKDLRRLFVSRDRFGEKPLYYAVRSGDLIFASEIKALLATGVVERSANPEMVADFCAERVSDHTTQTFFLGVSQIAPGTWAWWEGGQLNARQYWRAPGDDPGPPASDIVEEIAHLLEDSVRLRLRADTPIGTLLSGGLDSSGVTCLAARLASGGIDTFSTVDENPPEEARGIDLVLEGNKNINAHRDQPDESCIDEELTDCLWHQEEPFADGSMLAHFRLMRLARRSGVRVLLTGQAADEVFAGYPGHLAIHLGGLIRRGQWTEAATFHRALRVSEQSFSLRSVAGYALPARLSARIRLGSAQRSVDWLADGYARVTPSVGRGYAGTGDGDPLNAALRESLTRRTLPAFLHYEDRNSMAFGVETRIPFLDHRLVAKVLPLAGGVKLANARTKMLLRAVLREHVPAPIVTRLTKQGFPAPLSRWLRTGKGARESGRLEQVAACPLINFSKWRLRYESFMAGEEGELPAVWRGVVLSAWHARFMERTD